MEKRKLLLVAISAGIFLVIAIGAAIVFTPQQAVAPSRVATVYPAPGGTAINVTPPIAIPQPPPVIPVPVHPVPAAPVDPVDMVRRPVDNLGIQPAPQGVIRPREEFVVTGQPDPVVPTVITVQRPTAAAVPAPPPTPPPARTVAPAPAPAPRPAPVAAAPRPAPPPQAAVQPRLNGGAFISDYWIQAGSFSTMANAERAQESLASWGINSIIETRMVDGRNWFRVRIGPYPSQDEANHWLALIRSIDGFDSDLERYRPAVWQTARR